MPLRLPRIHVLLGGPKPRALASSVDVLSAGELRRLIALDVRVPPPEHGWIDRMVALERQRWAVGRRSGDRTVWRIANEHTLKRVAHPAWLWTKDAWFDPSVPERQDGPTPVSLPLRNQLRYAASLGGSRKLTIKCLASCVAALRRKKRPVAILVPPDALTSASTPARWFALGLLSTLPPSVRGRVRISVGDPAPHPRHYDVVITAQTPEGFRIIDAIDPPDEGRDLVAYYIRNRLHSNDPEALETAAFLYDGPEDDPWGEGIRRIIADGTPGVSAVNPEMLERDPEGSVRALRARLRAGASIDENVLEQLVSVTLKTRDHRPWRPLVVRPAVERARAVQALLERSSELQPRQQLVEVLGAIYPRGANLDSWCATLLSWVEDHDVSATALEILEETLIDWPASSTRASRASVWSEAVSALIRVGRYDAAAGAIRSSLAKQLATDGGSQALVDGWVSIPKAHRDARQLTELVDLLYTAPDRDAAVGRLFLAVREDKALTTELVRRWRKLCGDASLGDDDPLFAAMRRTGQLNDWVHAAVASAHPSELERVIRAIHRPPNDPVWVELEQAAASTYGTAPRDRFVNLTRLAQGLPALEPVARQIVGPAMESTTFPDRGIHNTALALIDVQDRSPIWPFVAISAGDPGTYEDEVVDATVVAFFEHAPASEPEVVAARICAHALGRAAAWEPLDHARWLVRLILAPDPSATGLNEQLAYTLIHALGTRPDAIDRLADITHAFFELPRDHLALRVFAERLLPNAWNGPVPYEFFHAIDHTRLPREVLQHWQAAGRDRW